MIYHVWFICRLTKLEEENEEECDEEDEDASVWGWLKMRMRKRVNKFYIDGSGRIWINPNQPTTTLDQKSWSIVNFNESIHSHWLFTATKSIAYMQPSAKENSGSWAYFTMVRLARVMFRQVWGSDQGGPNRSQSGHCQRKGEVHLAQGQNGGKLVFIILLGLVQGTSRNLKSYMSIFTIHNSLQIP